MMNNNVQESDVCTLGSAIFMLTLAARWIECPTAVFVGQRYFFERAEILDSE